MLISFILNITKDAWKLNIQASFFNLTRFFIEHSSGNTFLPPDAGNDSHSW